VVTFAYDGICTCQVGPDSCQFVYGVDLPSEVIQASAACFARCPDAKEAKIVMIGGVAGSDKHCPSARCFLHNDESENIAIKLRAFLCITHIQNRVIQPTDTRHNF
jgi:hypothetical protein